MSQDVAKALLSCFNQWSKNTARSCRHATTCVAEPFLIRMKIGKAKEMEKISAFAARLAEGLVAGHDGEPGNDSQRETRRERMTLTPVAPRIMNAVKGFRQRRLGIHDWTLIQMPSEERNE